CSSSMAEAASPVPPAPAQATPWVFRHRGLLIAAAFVLSILLARLLKDVWSTPIDQFLSVDARFQLFARAPAPLSWTLAVPVGLVLVCFFWRGWGTSYLRGHVMMDRAMHSDRLIVAGPFRWVRNPLYLGNLFMAAGFGLLLPPP